MQYFFYRPTSAIKGIALVPLYVSQDCDRHFFGDARLRSSTFPFRRFLVKSKAYWYRQDYLHGRIRSFQRILILTNMMNCCQRFQGRVQKLPRPDAGRHQLSLVSGPEGLVLRFAGSGGVASVYEIVLNANDDTSVQNAMRTGIEAAAETGTVMYIGASNSDGEPGQYRLFLHDLFR
jgi:hypothetical protein